MCLDKIAALGVEIHMFMVGDFIAALDHSGDLTRGQTMVNFDDLLLDKWVEMDEMLIADLDLIGIESPILVDIEDDNTWTMVDGHHRLAWAIMRNAEVPVVFVTMDTDPLALWDVMAEFESYYDHGLTETLV